MFWKSRRVTDKREKNRRYMKTLDQTKYDGEAALPITYTIYILRTVIQQNGRVGGNKRGEKPKK